MQKQLLEFHLQPIRKMVLAKVLFHFLDSKLFDLIEANEFTIKKIEELNLYSPKVLSGIIKYLLNEDIIEINTKDILNISKEWKNLKDFKPWYDLLIGGYSNTFDQIGDLLNSKKDYASRDSKLVGIGSCGISQHDALPMTMNLINISNKKFDLVLDIGCGDGSFLMDICIQKEELRGIGLDIEESSVSYGNEIANKLNLSDRVSFQRHEIGELPNISNDKNICIVVAFLLQEILEQEGEKKLIEFINSIFESYSKASMIVIEVDNQFDNRDMFKDHLAKAYYNPYYLLHVLTKQKLETNEYWTNLFNECGLNIIKIVHPSQEYDNLKLKIGYLIEKA